MLYLLGDSGRKSGRADANVYQRNNRLRRWIYPPYSSSPAQSSIRAVLSAGSSGWAALTDAQRNSWRTPPDSPTYTDRFGMTHPLTGKALYVQRYLNAWLANKTPLVTYQPSLGVNAVLITSITNTIAAGVLTALGVAYADSTGAATTDANTVAVVWGTPVANSARYKPDKGVKAFAYRAAVIPVSTASPQVELTNYSARFGIAAATGQNVILGLSCINVATFESSPVQWVRKVF